MSVTTEAVELRPRDAGRILGILSDAGSLNPKALWAEIPGPAETRFIYSVLSSRDPIHDRRSGPPDYRWHISVAGETDVPEWAHMVAIAHRLRPGICFVVGVPPRSWWINVHPHCLHLWETRDANLEAQWRGEARGDTPS